MSAVRISTVPTFSLQRPSDLNSVQVLSSHDLFERAYARGREQGTAYAGSLYPPEAWALIEAGEATLVDVRTFEELKFVGHVPNSLHVAWQIGPALIKNPRFLRELEAQVAQDEPIILLCRSGKRSAAAATAITEAGFSRVFNVLEGFEGDLDTRCQRGDSSGWRHWNLPWIQD